MKSLEHFFFLQVCFDIQKGNYLEKSLTQNISFSDEAR